MQKVGKLIQKFHFLKLNNMEHKIYFLQQTLMEARDKLNSSLAIAVEQVEDDKIRVCIYNPKTHNKEDGWIAHFNNFFKVERLKYNIEDILSTLYVAHITDTNEIYKYLYHVSKEV